MLYASIKTGIGVHLSDFGLNVLLDLLAYSSEIDAQALSKSEGKTVRSGKPMTLAEMTQAGRLKG